MLALRNVTKRFKGLTAVNDVSLDVAEGELVGIIGRNGAGKTTLFNLIAGRFSPSAGRLSFDATDMTTLRAHERARLGISRTFQIPEPLGRLNVLENVIAGAFNTVASRREAETLAREALDICGISQKAQKSTAELTVADLKQLEVARALATKPRLLLLDEVMAGLRPIEVREAMELCNRIRNKGVTLLVIEHVMFAVMNLCERVLVVEQGRIIADGAPAEIRANQRVIDVYFGRPSHA